MASSEELIPLLPETLPEDFGDWDSDPAPPPSPGHSDEREAWESSDSFGETSKPLWKPADRDAFLDSLGGRPRVSGSASSAPAPVEPQNDSFDHDSESFAMPFPITPMEWEAWEAARPFVKAPKPLGPSAQREAVLPPSREAITSAAPEAVLPPAREAVLPAIDKPRDSGSSASTPTVVQQPESTSELVLDPPRRVSQEPRTSRAANALPVAPIQPQDVLEHGTRRSPEIAAKLLRDADEALSQLFAPKRVEYLGEQATARKKWMIIAAVSVGAILLILLFLVPFLVPFFHHVTKSSSQPSVQPPAAATHAQPEIGTPRPPAHKSSTQQKPPATENPPGNQDEGVKSALAPTATQTKMMNDQLTAPTRIPKQAAEDADPPANIATPSGAGLAGTGTSIGLFNGHAKPVVKAAPSKPIDISSGVAIGLLIRKTEPIYPAIAKAARVAGTVVLHATISKDGTIEDLHTLSGPAMLRGAAIDAVGTWRYKPYKLNNVPAEVETTINVIFTLSQ